MSIFESMIKAFRRLKGHNPTILEYVILTIFAFAISILFKLISHIYTLFILSLVPVLYVLKTESVASAYITFGISGLVIVLGLCKFWGWLRHPVFHEDGKMPSYKDLDEKKQIIEQKLKNGEIDKSKYSKERIFTLVQWYLKMKRLQYSIPKSLFSTYFYKISTTILLTILSYGFIYFSLVIIEPTSIINESVHNPSGFTLIIESIYFSLTTFTTVGFGDIVPISIFAKVVVMSEIISGITVLIMGIAALPIFTIPQILRAKAEIYKDSHIEQKQNDG